MHARELVQIAALVAQHAPDLIDNRRSLSRAGMEFYWSASKCRLDRWSRALKRHVQSNAVGESPSAVDDSIFEEIFVGEILTRVWAAVCAAHDCRHERREAEPVARSVLVGHLEARHRALNLILHGPEMPAARAGRFNALRRRVEQWTDFFIGSLSRGVDVSQFAFHPDRAVEFASELGPQSRPLAQLRWQVLCASIDTAFASGPHSHAPNHDLNAAIARGILVCLPPELFDGTGTPRNVWQVRLFAIADDAQGMLDSLFSAESASPRNLASTPSKPASSSIAFPRRGHLGA